MTAEERRNRAIGASLTLLLHAGAAIAMYFCHLSAATSEPEPLASAKSEITFGGEYVQLGDIPLPNLSDGDAAGGQSDPAESGSDAESEGDPGDGEALVSSNQPSEATAPKRQSGPTEAELREQERIRKERETQEQEKNKINNRTSNAFSRSGSGGGNSGSPNGNSTSGALQGTPGHNLGSQYRLNVQRPSCSKSGTISVSVLVRSDGTIAEARYVGGTGAAAADASIRRQFEEFTKQLRFSVTGEVAAEKRGVITWQIN